MLFKIKAVISAIALICGVAKAATPFFKIKVVDDATGRGVPMVELETVNRAKFITDSAGVIAFNEPGLMNRTVFFHVRSHGYQFPKDGFGFEGVRLIPVAGGSATLKIKRLNVAERLYRVTGGGIYRDTLLLMEPAPIEQPAINADVVGQDSVQTVVYREKIFWFWGDTSRAAYPLGNYGTSGAYSELPSNGGLDPAVGVNLRYFTNSEGFSRTIAPWRGNNLVWIDGVAVVEDGEAERMITHYSLRESLTKEVEHGLAIWNDEAEQFDKLVGLPTGSWRYLRDHPVAVSNYLYSLSPSGLVRVPATLSAITNSDSYEGYSFEKTYEWRNSLKPTNPEDEKKVIKEGKLKPEGARFYLKNPANGKVIQIHSGSLAWNPYLKKWIWIFCEELGESVLGEIWIATADQPEGPWGNPVKIISHNKYSFYNPTQHDFFDQDNGRFIYIDGTYTEAFSGNPTATPYYDYNQIMYRLDLSKLK